MSGVLLARQRSNTSYQQYSDDNSASMKSKDGGFFFNQKDVADRLNLSKNTGEGSSGDENSGGQMAQNGRWTDEEHDKFIQALQVYGKNWNKVHKFVGTRTSAQTRSHAQKYFNKLVKLQETSKEGLSKEALEHLRLIGYGTGKSGSQSPINTQQLDSTSVIPQKVIHQEESTVDISIHQNNFSGQHKSGSSNSGDVVGHYSSISAGGYKGTSVGSTMITQAPLIPENCLFNASITQNINLEMMERLNLSDDANGQSPSARDHSNDEKMRDTSNEFEQSAAMNKKLSDDDTVSQSSRVSSIGKSKAISKRKLTGMNQHMPSPRSPETQKPIEAMKELKRSRINTLMRIRKDSLVPDKFKKGSNIEQNKAIFQVIKCERPQQQTIKDQPKFDFSGLQAMGQVQEASKAALRMRSHSTLPPQMQRENPFIQMITQKKLETTDPRKMSQSTPDCASSHRQRALARAIPRIQ
ncbi:hypothetical protein FGO68_gene5652 [Halteria grandinella]|uniref:Uncharacterized protein n=1 Tax=Halteria grandinella TaxID=5974 RepID=A0A8J8T831_HALGN|nr:hypothetical protein FGO68_gene5652 [Halteria grandinella]